MGSVLLLLQSTTPECTTESCTAQPVRLTTEQMQMIGEQINGAALYLGALLCVAIFALGALVFMAMLSGK